MMLHNIGLVYHTLDEYDTALSYYWKAVTIITEIESNCDALQRAYEERDLLLQKTSMEINTSLATVKGLCCTGLKDVDDPLAIQYLDRMNKAVDNFSNVISRLELRRNKLSAG